MGFINKNILTALVITAVTAITAIVIFVIGGNSDTAKALPAAPDGLFASGDGVATKMEQTAKVGSSAAGTVDAVGDIEAPIKPVAPKQSVAVEVKADKPKAPQAPEAPKNTAILVPAAESMSDKKQPVGLASPKAVQLPNVTFPRVDPVVQAAPDAPEESDLVKKQAGSVSVNGRRPVMDMQMPVAPTMPQMQMPIMVPDMQMKIHRPVMDTNIMPAPARLEMPAMPQMQMPPQLPMSMPKLSMPLPSVDTLQQPVNIPVPSTSVTVPQ